jgi:hypothetical protein
LTGRNVAELVKRLAFEEEDGEALTRVEFRQSRPRPESAATGLAGWSHSRWASASAQVF